jgi:hypothetical protein
VTVELDSALPVMLGVMLAFGDAGFAARFVGAPGAVESSTYVTLVGEQPEVLFAASVAVARNAVMLLSGTKTVMLKLPPLAVPVPTTALVQVEFV